MLITLSAHTPSILLKWPVFRVSTVSWLSFTIPAIMASSGSMGLPPFFLAAKIRPASPADSKSIGKTDIDDITECTAAFSSDQITFC